MPINPVTLDKIDYNVIRQIEHKIIDRIVHETKGAEIKRDNDGREFDLNRQKKAIEEFAKYLAKYSMKLEGKIIKNKVKLKITNKEGKVLIETYIDDVDSIFRNIQETSGNLIDLRG